MEDAFTDKFLFDNMSSTISVDFVIICQTRFRLLIRCTFESDNSTSRADKYIF